MLSVSHSLECLENATDYILSEQGILIVGVLVFTMLIIIIAYIAGTFTGNPNFLIFAKDEAWHFGFSVLILLLFSMILLLACNSVDFFYKTTLEELGTTTCYSSTAEMTAVSLCYLDQAKRDAERIAENAGGHARRGRHVSAANPYSFNESMNLIGFKPQNAEPKSIAKLFASSLSICLFVSFTSG